MSCKVAFPVLSLRNKKANFLENYAKAGALDIHQCPLPSVAATDVT